MGHARSWPKRDPTLCGPAGKVDCGRTVGTAFWMRRRCVSSCRPLPTSPVSADAVLLMSMRVEPGFDEARPCFSMALSPIRSARVRALEAFGVRGTESDSDICRECMIDAEFLEDSGFDLIAPHHRFPGTDWCPDEGLGWKSAVEGR